MKEETQDYIENTNVENDSTNEKKENEEGHDFVYDAQVTQILPFDAGDSEEKYHIEPISDERYIAYVQECALTTTGDDEYENDNGLEATVKLFDEHCSKVEGYEEPLPANWKSLIDPQDKVKIMNHYFMTAVHEMTSEKGKRVLTNNKSLTLECFFNGKIVELTHEMKPKNLEYIREYQKLIKKGVEKQKNKKLKAQMKSKYKQDTVALAELCKKLHVKASGYKNNDIPIWHFVDLVTDYLSASVDEKKS